MGWKTALIRPLTSPSENLRKLLWNQLLNGVAPRDFDFRAVVRSVATAFENSHVLVVIDQFEDVLGMEASSDIPNLTSMLIDLTLSAEPNVRFLISYRGDVESQIGPLWQKVSGSAGGLPRFYVGPLTLRSCELALAKNLQALGVTFGDESPSDSTVSHITADLASESLLNGYAGIYPPFLQMIIARVRTQAAPDATYNLKDYRQLGGARAFIAEFLFNQLKFLGGTEEAGKEMLIALVSSYGTKTQKTLKELSLETARTTEEAKTLLTMLIDLRMVRSIDGHFEIVHDFLAKTILSELVSSEEKEAKKFKQVLSSRAAAYGDTRAILTTNEHVHLYKYRTRIICTETEARLLLLSHLIGNGPINFWIQSLPKKTVLAWLESIRSLQDIPDITVNQRAKLIPNVYRALVKQGLDVTLPDVISAFPPYELRFELASYISGFATRNDVPLLLQIYRKRRSNQVAEACRRELLKLVTILDEDTLDKAAKAPTLWHLFGDIAFNIGKNLSLEQIRELANSRMHWKKLLSIYALGLKGDENDADWFQRQLIAPGVTGKYIFAFTKALTKLAYRLKKPEILSTLLMSKDPAVMWACLEEIDKPLGHVDFAYLLSLCEVSDAAIRATCRLAKKKNNAALKELLRRLATEQRLSRESEGELIFAICDTGGPREFKFLLNFLLNYEGELHVGVKPTLNAIASLATSKHMRLLESMINTGIFWEGSYVDEHEKDQIPVKTNENLYFIKWLLGVAYAKLADRAQLDTLRKMLTHPFWTVRNAAVERIVHFGQPSDISWLVEDTLTCSGDSEGLLRTLCRLDEKFFPLPSR